MWTLPEQVWEWVRTWEWTWTYVYFFIRFVYDFLISYHTYTDRQTDGMDSRTDCLPPEENI